MLGGERGGGGGSGTVGAVTWGRRWPITTAWAPSRLAAGTALSMLGGGMFVPAALMISSFGGR